MTRGPSIRYLLLLANVFILLVPLFGVVFLRLWDTHLVRVTEEQLIGEAVVLDAAWRARLAPDAAPPPPIAIDAVLDRRSDVLPPAPPPQRFAAPADNHVARAGAELGPVLNRIMLLNGGEVALLDRDGCAVAATGSAAGACLDNFPEVAAALHGRYRAVTRQPAEGSQDWHGLGAVRVDVALPVRVGTGVIGAVWLSRPSSSPFEALWDHRGTVLFGVLACGVFMAAVTHFFSRAISRPVRAITAVAEAIARGEPPQPFAPRGVVPAEVHALSDALDRMTGELTARTQYVADFAATASHELKTPITGIRGAVELLRDAWREMPDDQRERFLANIDADAARMQRVVTRLLQLARIQSGADAASRVEVAPFFETLARRYDGRVRLAVTGAPADISINPDHLEEAVGNLLDNAVRHSAGQPVDLEVGAQQGRLVVRVHDHGDGISLGNQPRIFERFFTTERDRGGTGLGLAIVRAIADTRGGAVTFESGPAGTTFTLTV